jgi:hypothetical protein
MSGTTFPIHPEIAAQLREQTNLVRKFKRALIADNVDALDQLCAQIDMAFIWPRAMRHVMHMEQDFSADVKTRNRTALPRGERK